MKALVIEDDPKILSFVRLGLQEQGLTVDTASNGDEGLCLCEMSAPDVVVLDIMMPGRDGLSVLRELRARQNTVPVILLTARSALHERIEGLDLGADDYLTKPFFVEELVARIHAVVRRASGDPLTVRHAGEFAINLINRQVRRDAQVVDLTAREFAILELLTRSAGRVYTRTQLLEHVWGYGFDPQTNVVDVSIRRLRAKLDREDVPSWIETVRGVGYRFRQAG